MVEKEKLDIIKELETIKEQKNHFVQIKDYDNATILRDKEVAIIKKLGKTLEESVPTWYNRSKTYISDFMDEDIINSPISKELDRVVINNLQITNKKCVEDIIEFLQNVKESLKY